MFLTDSIFVAKDYDDLKVWNLDDLVVPKDKNV